MSQDAMRVALHSMGVPIDEEWVIQEVSVKRDIEQVPQEDPDAYGNVYNSIRVTGQQVSIVVYRPEN